MKRLLILLVLISTGVQAEIYKSQNEKGEWVYSDRRSPSAEAMKLPPLSTYTPPPKKPEPDPAEQEQLAVYRSMVFLKPENKHTIRDQEGSVNVRVQLNPLLKNQRGHKIQYYIDGSPHGVPMVSSKAELKGLERGEHVLGASVLDADGKELIRAASVIFYIRRESALNPNNLNNPNNPRSIKNPDNIANNPNNPYHADNNPRAPGPINPNPVPKPPKQKPN